MQHPGLGWADKAAASHWAPLPCQAQQSLVLLLCSALTVCSSCFLGEAPLGIRQSLVQNLNPHISLPTSDAHSKKEGEVLFSPLAPFCWRAVQLMGCKSHPASLCPSASRMVGMGHGWWQPGVTLHSSSSPTIVSLWLWGSACSSLRNRTWICLSVLETLWLLGSSQGMNQEMRLVFKTLLESGLGQGQPRFEMLGL